MSDKKAISNDLEQALQMLRDQDEVLLDVMDCIKRKVKTSFIIKE